MPFKNIEDKRAWGRRYAREWRKRNPDRAVQATLRSRDPAKHRARAAVAYAKRMGHLVPAPCEVCGSPDVEAHHDDYEKKLEVRWLCRPHHVETEMGLRC